MVFLRVLLLWGLVSVHVVGAAFLFRRLFPSESRWLAFLVPELVIVLVCNFVEHHTALTALRFVLPVTTIGSVVLIAGPKRPWRIMRLPTLIFLGAFAFSLVVRALRPDIEDCRDGIYDLGIISNFMFGQTLPVESTWLPPVKLLYYYCLAHYGASVLIRLLGVDLGTGLNLCTALLSTYIYFLAGAIAWHLGRGKLWIAILMPTLTACGATGAVGYLVLTLKDLVPVNIVDLNSLLVNQPLPDNWLLQQMTPVDEKQGRELLPPGIGSWMGSFHSMIAGQLVFCFVLLALIELLRRKQTNWPWICVAISPFLIVTTCTWGLPMVGFIVLSGLIVCVRTKIVPANLSFVLAASAGLMVLLEPMLSYFLQAPSPAVKLVPHGLHTQWPEFLLQWWPVFIPWLALCCIWPRLSQATRIVLVMTPLAFAGVEIFNINWRSDMTGKTWGMIYAAAWVMFLPVIAREKALLFRAILVLVVINCALSLCFWGTYYARTINPQEIGHLDGIGRFGLDRRKARILETLSRLDNQIVIAGRLEGDSDSSPSALLIELSHNRAYTTWEVISDYVFFPNGIMEAARRFADVNALYDGKLNHPLYFLRQRNISAVVIYPDDNIDASVVENLKKDLAPYYTFEDANFRSGADILNDVSPARPCAGVFVYHPEITTLLGPAKNDEMK